MLWNNLNSAEDIYLLFFFFFSIISTFLLCGLKITLTSKQKILYMRGTIYFLISLHDVKRNPIMFIPKMFSLIFQILWKPSFSCYSFVNSSPLRTLIYFPKSQEINNFCNKGKYNIKRGLLFIRSTYSVLFPHKKNKYLLTCNIQKQKLLFCLLDK